MKTLILSFLTFIGAITMSHAETTENHAVATFAGGCFWCMESEFAELDGILGTKVGYTGGHIVNPTYKQVSSGSTGHIESIQIKYDPTKISYDQLLEIFWTNVDPTDDGGQFCDRGEQYTAGIFFHGDEQNAAAMASAKKVQARLGQPVKTFFRPAEIFYEAEDYHQEYYKKNSLKYKFYKYSCGRQKKLDEVWSEEN